uniref:Uncharacterized protein n=1 Tax=Aegilops tauschii subsp. strangulata TaxID=200361 RepID=A0A452Y471_AEGTS
RARCLGLGLGAAVVAVPDAVRQRRPEVEGGGLLSGAGARLGDLDPLGRPAVAAGAAEVEVADAVAAHPGDAEGVGAAPLEGPPARRAREARAVRLVAVRVPERHANRVRRRRRRRAARLHLHRVRARPHGRLGCGGRSPRRRRRAAAAAATGEARPLRCRDPPLPATRRGREGIM